MPNNESNLEMDRALIKSYSAFLKKILEKSPESISIKTINGEKFLLLKASDFGSLIEKFYEVGEKNW